MSYLIAMKEKLEGMVCQMRKNKGRAKERQTECYEMYARERELKVGANMLVLCLLVTASCWQSGKSHIW